MDTSVASSFWLLYIMLLMNMGTQIGNSILNKHTATAMAKILLLQFSSFLLPGSLCSHYRERTTRVNIKFKLQVAANIRKLGIMLSKSTHVKFCTVLNFVPLNKVESTFFSRSPIFIVRNA